MRAQGAYPDGEAIRKVITIRGRTGAVIGIVPAAGERAEHVAHAIAEQMSVESLQQVHKSDIII